MIVTAKISKVREACATQDTGFVPTMGALHDGHVSLIRAAREQSEFAAVSIFVNPAQFGPNEDLSSYPRALESDLAQCDLIGVDLVFAPELETMYPDGLATTVKAPPPADVLEGIIRPGHFDGVCTIVTKLFNVVRPARTYFGQKDAQQLRVVSNMVRDLDIDSAVVACPTVRSDDGLALSSRNALLKSEDRKRALVLYESLRVVASNFNRGVPEALAEGRRVLERNPPDKIDYLECVDPLTFQAPGNLVVGAIRIGDTRLIDNMSCNSF